MTSFIVEAGMRGVPALKEATGVPPPAPSSRQTSAVVEGFARLQREIADWTSPGAAWAAAGGDQRERGGGDERRRRLTASGPS